MLSLDILIVVILNILIVIIVDILIVIIVDILIVVILDILVVSATTGGEQPGNWAVIMWRGGELGGG